MATTINVTQEDIDEGQMGECYFCPVALAASKMIKGGCWVNETHIRASGDDEQEFILSELPEEACKFIRDFDSGNPVHPFQFTLDIPEEFLKEKL